MRSNLIAINSNIKTINGILSSKLEINSFTCYWAIGLKMKTCKNAEHKNLIFQILAGVCVDIPTLE